MATIQNWSPKDSRKAVPGFGPGPNTGQTQNSGAVFYLGQVSDNPGIPPVDSRAAGAPVDSRTVVPINSRVSPNGYS